MTMLPDIDEQAYDDYQQQQFGQSASSRIAGLGFDHSSGNLINGLGALIPSSDALTNPLGTGNAPPPTPPPVQEPTPPPPAEAPTPDQQPVEAPAPQPVAPSPLLQRPPPMQPNDAPAPLPAPDAPVTTPLRAPSSMQPGQDTGYAFPVQGFKGPVNQHWGDVNGGSDLFAPRGTPVVAMRGGRVIESGANPVGGNAVLIQGDDGNQYYYAHFDASPSVKVGQDVTAGTYLGPVGDTGDAKGTGTHLHLGIGPDIRLGADKYGGTGGDYDAVGLLRSTLEGKPPQGNQVSYEPMAAQTTAGMSGGGQLAGKIGDAGRAILSGAADSASWLGEQGQKALQAVLITEGGLNGARGDRGMSAGPLQFYEGGQLANFAKQAGLTLDQAKTYVEQHPNEAVQWAIGTATNPGYLGGAIAQGIAKGLTGADLATFAQRVGQVSVSPERAGQNFNALFAGGGQLVSDAADAVRNNVFAPVQAAAQSVGSMFTDAQTPTPRSASSMFAPTSTDQVAASASSMALPPAPAEPQASPVERLKSAFSDFVDSIGGTAGSVGGKLASSILAPDTSTPPPRSSMPLPSDALTNPTPYENTPATGPMAPPTRPTVFDRLGEAIGPFAETAILGTPEDRAARATQPSPPEFRPLPDDQIGPGEILSSAAGALFGQPFGQVQSQAQKQEAVTSAQQAFAEASPTTGLGPDITLPGQEQPTHLGGTLIQGLVDQVIQNPLVFAPGAALGEELTNFGGTIVQDFLPQLGSTAGRLTAAAINGAVQNAIFEVGQPNATPQSIGEQFLAGAGFGGALHGGGELASSLGRRVLEGLPSLEPALRSRQRAEGINPFAAFGGAEEPTAARRPSEPSVAVGGETGQSRLPGFEDTPSSTAVEGPTTAEGHPVVTSSRVVTGPVEQVGAAGTRAATMAGDLTGEPAANDVERMFNGLKAPPREAPVTGPTQIFGPEGDVISTISRAEGEPGLTSIVRTGRGAEVGEANAETRQRMPNIEKVAPENADIRATIQRTAEENPQLMDAYRRGVITHKQLIEDLAPRLGMTADDFLKSPIGKAYNAEELLALNATMINAEAESVRAANRIAEAGGIANLTPEDKLQFARQQLDAARLQLVARGGSSEAGRTLNQQKIAITEEMARSVVGGNERVAAERSLETATERQSRTDTLVERDRGLQAEKKAAVTEAENITRRRQPTRNPEVQKVVDEPTPLDKMSEVARIDREIIDARRARETERVTSLTRERDGIVADVRGTLETKLQAALDARAAAEPVSATMDSAHRAQGQRLLSFVRKEVDAALNPMTQARTAGQLGDAVHKALLKALKAADAEGAAHSKHLTDTLNAISRAYDDLSAYHAMSLEEKTADFSGRAAKRAEAAEKRAEAARNAGEPEKLLKALQDEIAAERKLFKGKETTRRALADQQRLRELAGLDPRESVALQEKNRTAQASGTKAWLEAQRKQAQQESTRANEELQRSHQKRVSVAGRQREVARRLLENMGGDVTDKALQVYVDLVNEGDMLAAAKYLRGYAKTSWWQRGTILRYGSMLSSTATQLSNIFSNTVGAGFDIATKPAAVGLDVLRAGITGGERTRYMGEFKQQLRGEMEGGIAGWKMAAVALRSGVDPRMVSKAEQSRGAFNIGQTRLGSAIGERGSRLVDTAAEAPSRLLLAADLFFRGAAQGGHVRALATRRGIQAGQTGEALGRYVDNIVQNVTEYPSLLAEADKLASRAVLQESRGGARVATLFGPRESGPAGFAQSVLVPFVRTPYNIAAQGLGMTPLGLLGVAEAGMKGQTGEATDRAARVLFGSAVMGMAGILAANDFLTGAMPTDASARSALPPGWQPWSLKVPDGNGNATFISYQNLGPVGVPLAMGAVMGEAWHQKQPIDPSTVAAGFGRYMVDQTFLQSIDALVKTFEQPKRYAENLVEGFVAPTVPYRALQVQIARAIGMADRDPHGAMEALQASFLPTMEQVAPRLTPLGDPVQPAQTGIAAFASPLRYNQSQDTEVLRALRMNDVGVPDMPKELTVAGGVLALTQQEQDRLQAERGRRINQYVQGALADPAYGKLNDIGRQKVLRRAVSNATTQVDDAFANKIPADEFAQRRKQKVPQPYVA